MTSESGKPLWQADRLVEGRLDGMPVNWHVPEEAPVATVYNGINHAVMLATPDDLEDFAIGFTLTEGIAPDVDGIKAVEVRQKEQGIDLKITLSDASLEKFKLKRERRNLVGRTGCGLCGIDSMEQLFYPVKSVGEDPKGLDVGAVKAAVEAFHGLQPLKSLNKSVHGAAWVDIDGTIRLVREDVGRHNALDKLLGALVKGGTDMGSGFVLATSRASYEMVQKCVILGVPALVCLSSPTAFAVRMAKAANLTLGSWSDDGLVIF